jgi:amidase
MARSVDDLALLLSVQAGYDARSPLSLPGSGTVYRQGLDVPVKGCRIGWLGDFGGAAPHEPEAWQQSGSILSNYRNPAERAQLKAEAIWEVETGLPLSAFDITAASEARTTWSMAVKKLFDQFDYVVLPSSQVFPFAIEERWPKTVAGVPMRTYHEWMKSTLLITLAGNPALAVPAGFGAEGLPIGLQIVAPNRCEISCLQIAKTYEAATGWTEKRPPAA